MSKTLTSSRFCRFSSMLPSKSFIFTFLSTTHYEVFFFFCIKLWCLGWDSVFCLWISNFSIAIYCKDYPSYWITFAPVKSLLAILVWVNFWVLIFVPLIYVSVPLPISHSLDYCSYIISFEIRKSDSSHFIFQIFLAILVLLHCYKNFRIILSIYTKNISRILIGISLNLSINLGGLVSLLYWVFQTMNTVYLSI